MYPVDNDRRMAYDMSGLDMDIIRRNYRFVALASLSVDLAIIAVIWLFEIATSDIRLVITVALLSSGLLMSYFFIKVLPDRIAKSRGLS